MDGAVRIPARAESRATSRAGSPQRERDACETPDTAVAWPSTEEYGNSGYSVAEYGNSDAENDAVIAAILAEDELELSRQQAAAMRPPNIHINIPIPLDNMAIAGGVRTGTPGSLGGSTLRGTPTPGSFNVAPKYSNQRYSNQSNQKNLKKKKPFYKSPGFICLGLILALIAIILPVALWSSGVFTPPKPKPPPVWIDWYNATGAREPPLCELQSEDPAKQPSYATFPDPMPMQPVYSLQREINLNTQYGLDETLADNFQALQRALSDCRNVDPSSGCRLVMRRGIYRFSTERPVYFDSLTNFTLDGNSSVFLFSRRSQFSRLTAWENGRTVHLRNLQIDWDWSTFRLASLVQIDRIVPTSFGGQDIQMRFLDHPLLDLATIRTFQDMHAVDPLTLTVGLRTPNRGGQYWNLSPLLLSLNVTYDPAKGTNNTVHALFSRALSPAPDIGGLYLIRHFTYESPALQFVSSRDVWIDGVSVWGAAGMALVIQPGSKDFRITNFTVGILANRTVDNVTRIVDTSLGWLNVTHLPTTNSTLSLRNSTFLNVTHLKIPALTRHISTTADALHATGLTGHLHISDSTLGFQGDDCVNVNHPIVSGFRRMSSTRVILNDWESNRLGGLAAGDRLEFRNPDFSPTGVVRTVTDAGWVEGQGWLVELGEGLPQVGEGGWWGGDGEMVVWSLKYAAPSTVLIRRLSCHSNRARGILFQSPRGVIERSCFTNIQKRALSITAEIQQGNWAEGMGVRELVVAGNRVRGVDKLDDYLGVLWTGAIMANGSISGFPLLQGIEISNNTFEEFPRRGVVVQSAAGVVVRGNVFNNSLPNDPPAPERGQLLVDRSSNVAITDNTWTLGKFTANPFVRVEGTAGNVSIVGNALV